MWEGSLRLKALFISLCFPGGTNGKELICQCRKQETGVNRWVTLEGGMATPSSILVWRIQWSEEPGRPHSMALLGHGLSFHCSTMPSCTALIPKNIVPEMAQICFLSSMLPTSVYSHSFPSHFDDQNRALDVPTTSRSSCLFSNIFSPSKSHSKNFQKVNI